MNLQIKPSYRNAFPCCGLLIKGTDLYYWLQQLQHLEADLSRDLVYAIPGTTANSLWGCFVSLNQERWKNKSLNAIEPCQLVYHNLYIPQFAELYPKLNAGEAEKLFSEAPHILHPEFGLFVLDTPVLWSELLQSRAPETVLITKPADVSFVPATIRRLEIEALPPSDVLKEMEESIVSERKKFEDRPLDILEKIKLGVLRKLFSKSKNETGNSSGKLLNTINKLFRGSKWMDKLELDLEELERRNETELQKLLELLKSNPEEALKYAIPLDDAGTARGGNRELFKMSKRWNNFDLFKTTDSGRSGSALTGDNSFAALQTQYLQTAKLLIAKREYQRAAFVYLKLLKNKQMAAKTLEDGKLYAEAASVYLTHLQNKSKAAECYEKGQMLGDAIVLYKELKQNEKAGDLYIRQNKQKEAFEQYQVVVDDHIQEGKYVKASLLYRYKMNTPLQAQELLLSGWRTDKDAFNCLNNYFKNMEDKHLLMKEIEHIYKKETNDFNKPVFLTALQYEYKKDAAIALQTREIAYQIIADLATGNPAIVSELKHFNQDKSLSGDVLRYKMLRRQG